MANINIKRFVDINILHHATSAVSSIRDTVVLLSNEGSAGIDKVYTSFLAFTEDGTSALTTTTAYVKVFFDNGGNKLRVIQGITQLTLADTIKALDDKFIVVAYTGVYDDIKSVAQARELDTTVYGINQKILLGRLDEGDDDEVKNFAVKFSDVVGAEMTIAAYLSNIDIYGTNTIHDYAFTKEVLTQEDITDTELGDILDDNMNVSLYVANAVRNIGGNLKDGLDIVNQFTLIVLHQTLTERVLNLLVQKIKGQAGLAAINSVLSQELSRYLTNGYLSTDKVWTDGDLTIEYNGMTFPIIAANTPLPLGYHITIVPLSAISNDDKALRKTPPIYVIIADAFGLRLVTINGEVV